MLAFILSNLEDSKADDVVSYDLRGRTAIGDHLVICSGRSTRQVSAIAQSLLDDLKQTHSRLARTEGKEAGDWVVLDTGDVIVHIFRPEVREFYKLEEMWQPTGDSTARAN